MISAVIYLIGVWSRALGLDIIPVLTGLCSAAIIELIIEFVVWMVFLDIKERKHRKD